MSSRSGCQPLQLKSAMLQVKTETLNISALMEEYCKWAQTWSDDRSGQWDPPPEVSNPTSKANPLQLLNLLRELCPPE